ncbi:hypothetical protein GCM10009814_21110 [Lapillicoccus jejuensis]
MLRLTRAAVLGAATVGLSLGAHVAAGGGAPTPVGLGLLSLPVLAVTLVATGRRLSGPALAALLGLGQVGLHVGLTALTAEPALVATDGSGPAPTGGHHLLHLALGSPLTAGTAGTVGAAGGPALMTLAHLVAAALVALLLTRGEHALWALLAWLLPRLPGAAHPREAVGGASVPADAPLHPSRRARRRRSRAPPVAPAAVLARPSHGPAGPSAAIA